ncbi:MAG: cytochrome-c oxidase, cbb3-type subunit III [Marinomonas sp.]|jgi:cytochrome c oxidase cbb3-type subunit 3|uniref:Cbb3-type cytochrome c oxidase subunit n=1 Tax=Marinomonas communis TaxID=28254 RepID=A0A4R6XCQ1_9GAMM|nr:cytochrome-c oxidase, cbb3-type subunit III [Marinomonas communis]MEC8082168.1 cytochrome-c oxidase, cbb3-type subunit III [Pseudomonadota bacterium]RUM50396.1 MAG: cytochrome-c oxidase, cbb3-type subunit III [Marinomonas sp.]MCC4275176.1 cytochrome-c oxidase, cbb3-type subunit III [Marinomonas communis]MEC8484452.1 cytochrome-c oxidase, cbb3-type subunit III [Pseudomonadota bacterium]RUM50456.1 MAG: cytochrome-c oxidase, cbb3-type subunit III [Marinomonas sp.]
MNELTSFWSGWIIVISLGSILGSFVLLSIVRKGQRFNSETTQTVGHEFDGIEEYDNPLPRWWYWMFVLTVIFALGYLTLYPGLGNFKGVLGWTQESAYEREVAKAEAEFGPMFAQFSQTPIEELAKNDQAMRIGQRLFANNCAQCHGSAATGSYGFPNLTDNDWLYGGDAAAISQTILNGRIAAMPAWGAMLGEEGVHNVTQYVLNMSGREADADSAAKGQQLYNTNCIACHGAEGKGNHLFGAPNLTDNIWLYGGSEQQIMQTIRNGRNGQMPAWEGILGKDKSHVVAGYVYSLSNQ